ncbi:MAG: YARHG domain-containing protein [Salinivirgaceae bacterium]|nr:YARHG domain-containing protein [Salinivirgaceae bacterium]
MQTRYLFFIIVALLFCECSIKQTKTKEVAPNKEFIILSDTVVDIELKSEEKQLIDTFLIKSFDFSIGINVDEINENVRFLYHIDSVSLKVFKQNIENSNRFIDYVILDALEPELVKGGVYKLYIDNRNLFFCSGSKDSTYFYQLSDSLVLKGKVSKSPVDVIYGIFYYADTIFYYFNEKDKSISSVNLSKNETNILFQMSDMLDSEQEFVSGYRLFEDKYILEFGEWAGGYSSLSYFLYDIEKNKLEDITYNFKGVNNLEYNFFYMHSSIDDSKLFIHTLKKLADSRFSCVVDKDKLEIANTTIFKEILAPSSKNKYKLIGYDESNKKTQNIYFKVKLNDKFYKYAYKPNSELELLYFKLFSNKLLLANDMVSLTTYELKLLANMIFAKHGYDFDDFGLRIYFNYYNFYYSQENKTKEVWDRFDEVDYNNLWLIIQTINKIKKH